MIRRKFINSFSITLTSLLSFPLKAISSFFLKQAESIVIDNRIKPNNKLQQIGYLKKYNLYYISINDFARVTGFGIYTNDVRQKSVLYVGQDKATFTAANSFVILNDHTYQFPYQPIWQESEVWIPVELLVTVFSKYTANKFNFDKKELILTLGAKDVNITGLFIETRDNGTLIRVRATKKFLEKDITTKIANGWFHIDIFGGKADSSALKAMKVAGVVSAIDVIEFDQIISLAFKLKKSILSKELIFDNTGNDFFVNLRTEEEIETDEQVRDELEKQKKEWLIDTIVIDPGHGGKDPGAIGYGGLREKDIVLKVGLKLEQILNKHLPEVKIVFTRKTDKFIPLWKRTKMANEANGKLFISLHCNSNKSRQPNGFETYFLSADKDKNKEAQAVVLKENAAIKFEEVEDQKRYEGINFILATMAQSAFIRQSQYLASTVQSSFAKKLKPLGMKDRGVKQGRFWVMVGATMPNILVEMGFISNKFEANLLKKNSTQQKVAEAIFDSVKQYKTDIEAAI